MAQLLKDDFSAKGPISQVPASWFNRVAKILNGMVAGLGISINKDGTDTAGFEIGLNEETARTALGIPNIAPNTPVSSEGHGDTEATLAAKYTPADILEAKENESNAEKVARIGSKNECARADHKHRDRTVFTTQTKPDFSEMFKCEISPNGYGHVLSFYPPIVDNSGRWTGISDEPAWEVDLLDNV